MALSVSSSVDHTVSLRAKSTNVPALNFACLSFDFSYFCISTVQNMKDVWSIKTLHKISEYINTVHRRSRKGAETSELPQIHSAALLA